ncbi:hypothetical protein D1P53_002625 [Cryptococcus gattii VGV]|nr:hypothetical protein D1P53_002625 [Cryptococcus gattii VGV]
MGDSLAVEEQRSALSFKSCVPEPKPKTGSDMNQELVKRCRAMIIKLLPVEVGLSQITDATSSVITPEVISSFAKSGGDFGKAVPFALLRVKALFMAEAHNNPADYDENLCRATAAEVLARRIVHNLPIDKLESIMSTRYRYRESDGDESAPSSALEIAIDHHDTIFLSSSEAEHVVNCLWRGDLVQRNNENMDIDYVPYQPGESSSFWAHLNPDRMSVPRYQSTFKIVVWCIFLFVYSQSVQTPLESFNAERNWDGYEIVLYVMALAFLIEETVKMFKIIRIAPRPMATVSLYALDAADGETGGRGIVINNLIQALLGAPDFDSPSERFGYPFGLIIFYGWNFVATIILVNVLIALFGSAYSDVIDNETDEYLVFFAHKTIDLIRAPDSYVYLAPFNLIEAFLIAPFEWILSRDMYIALNRHTMTVLFFVPLTFIAFFESQISHSKNRSISAYFNEPLTDEEGDPVVEDPTCENDDNGEISRTKFEDLISVFPDTTLTEGAGIHREMMMMRKQLDRLEAAIRSQG